MLSSAISLGGCANDAARPQASESPSTQVPSDWKTLASDDLGFSLRFPPDWGPRPNGTIVPVQQGCKESMPSLDPEGEPDDPYECQLEPEQARTGPPDPGFYLGVRVERLSDDQSMDEVLEVQEGEGVQVGAATFGGRQWTRVDFVDPDCCPPTKDYGYCRRADGEPSQCTTREYVSDHGNQLVFRLELWAQSPEELSEFEDLAEQAARSIRFD